jgi:hypothetical protein
MRTITKSSGGSQKMPSTQMVSLLNDRLIIAIRSWNGVDSNQKIIDEISHYLSSVEADLEVTSPFEYSENMTVLANKVKIAMLLANESIYSTENRTAYQSGAEVTILFQKDSELAWASIGRFSAEAIKEERKMKLFDSGAKFDDEILLPVNLIGIIRHPEVLAGSLVIKKLQRLDLKSLFQEHEAIWECSVTQF